MDIAVDNMVNSALLMQQAKVDQEKQMLVLKKALEAQSFVAVELLQPVAQKPKLATEGMVGTRINTFA